MPGPKSEYEFWGQTADTYDVDTEYVVGAEVNRQIADWLAAHFRAEDHVLELGCGTGLCSTIVAGCVAHLTLTDMSPEMLAQAARRFVDQPNVQIQREDSYNTSFLDESFDAAVMANLLHVVQSPQTVVSEAHRVLRPGGRAVVVDYTTEGLSDEQRAALAKRYFSRWGKPPEFNRPLDMDRMAGLLTDGGFEILDRRLFGTETKAICVVGVKGAS